MSFKPDDRNDDLSALAWVQEELRRSLDTAHKALRRFVKETEALGASDIDAVDPAVLRSARSQIHQGVGALELVGQGSAAAVLRASEALVQRFISKPQKLNAAAVGHIEQASFALLDFLGRRLAGKSVSALSLFPQYRAVLEAAAADRVHPADLWAADWQWRELPADPSAQPRRHDAATHDELEAQLLPLMRAVQPSAAAARMSDISAGLGAGASQTPIATLWKLAAGVFEAQAQGLLGFDVFSKRVASRLLAQFRSIEEGREDVSERLAQDLLFFCAQSASPGGGHSAPRLAMVRQAYGLVHHVPVDYSMSVLGRFDPAVIAQARKRVAAAKEAWSAVAGGEMHRLTGLSEQFALVGESMKRLFPLGESLAAELQQVISQTQQAGGALPAPLAMELATSLLYVEASLEDADFDHPDQAARVRRLAQRLAAVRRGSAPEALEGWMEELYRRVSDRQTMGSVVQELRASLSEAEVLIDRYFRNPQEPQVLIPVPNQLSAMRGVLSVLGMDHASAALLRMRAEIDGLITTGFDPQGAAQDGVFDRLASNLGALGFLIDMLSVQPQMAKSLFTHDAQTGILRPVMGRRESPVAPAATPAPGASVGQRLIEQAQLLAFSSVRDDISVAEVSRDMERLSHEAIAADQPALAAAVQRAREAIEQSANPASQAVARGELSEALVDFVSTASDPAGIDPHIAARVTSPMVLDFSPSTASAQLAQDDEMREIFLEEAREVLDTATQALSELSNAPDDLTLLTTLRRAFHTLKGSSRMVGLKEFGDAGWACEQLYNTHLADQAGAPAPLVEFTEWCLRYLAGWVDDIAARRTVKHDAATVIDAAARVGDVPVPLATPPTPTSVIAPVEFPALDFELDLSDLGGEVPADAAGEPAVATAHAPFDLPIHALPDPFESMATEPLPLPLTIEEPLSEAITDWSKLDLELDFNLDVDLNIDIVAPSTPQVEATTTPATPEIEAAPPHVVPEPAQVSEVLDRGTDEELTKAVGPLRISIPLFNIYLNEADELSRRLTTEVAEWAMELHRPIGEAPIALAHSLAGSSATVGFSGLSQLARALEHAQARSMAIGHGTADEAQLFVDAADEVRRLLHQFAAGFLTEPSADVLARLADHELSSARRLESAAAAAELPPLLEPDVEPVSAACPLLEPDVEPLSAAQPLLIDTDPADRAVADAEPVAPDTAAAGPVEATAPDLQFDAPLTRFESFSLAELKPFGDIPAETKRPMASSHALVDADDAIDAVDAVDEELFPIFAEEAEELLPKLANSLRDWVRKPGEGTHPAACMRTLHTLKGGARLAGAMRLGEMAHRLESRIERVLSQPSVGTADVEALEAYGDALVRTFDALRAEGVRADDAARAGEPVEGVAPFLQAAAEPAVLLDAAPPTPAIEADLQPVEPPDADLLEASGAHVDAMEDGAAPVVEADAAEPVAQVPAAVVSETSSGVAAPIAHADPDWSRFARTTPGERRNRDRGQAVQSAVRVRAPVLDRLVNNAGEVSITRSRIETGVGQIKSSLADLTENLDRLRSQLRDIEFHGELQMSTRLEAAKAASQSFDPLEFDRFTRFQELTRMMAESVNDVATVQRTLQRSLEVAEDELVAQARMTRELQDDLLRTRMVEFEGLSDRLYRVVRQAAKETGKSVRLDLVGASIEVDRGVLDRMTGAFEHLLRNCVSHGIEMPEVRAKAGKDAIGSIIVALTQAGNEVGVEFRDDGAGLDLQRIRAKGLELGLIEPNAQPTDAELANLIFAPGFSTAEVVTELSGRGVGMDVVRAEVSAIGGRIETATAAGQGTSFKVILPLTTAVTQVVMLRCGDTRVAVPTTLVENVRRADPRDVDAALASGSYQVGDQSVPFFWLGSLLQLSPRAAESTARMRSVVVIRSAQQRVALHVDEVIGNQEVVVKNLGPQLSRLPGLAGITLLASGEVALIYNPVALATLYGDAARTATQAALRESDDFAARPVASEPEVPQAPLVMVVDDSLTVRRVTQRLLLREGYRVVLAKDGLDALERLAEGVPEVVLSDIEMPRMDGFDLVRNMRADARLRDLPVIMITSRIAQKHRDHAAELGVDHYLGKPYSEEDLLALIARYTRPHVAA